MPEGNDATLESEKTPKEDNGIMPLVAYDYNIPFFSLVGYEYAWTTRSGYGFYINNEGYNHRNLNVSFNVVQQKGTPSGILALVRFSDWADATQRAKIQSDVKRYAYAYKEFSGAGNKTVSFNSLAVDTKWVFIWKNAASGSEFDIKNGNVYSSY